MSSMPYPEGVTKVMESLARLEVLTTSIAQLKSEGAKIVAQLKAAEEEWSALDVSVRGSLDHMDLTTQGNIGFGGRMGWFLNEMRRQIEAEVKSKMMPPGTYKVSP